MSIARSKAVSISAAMRSEYLLKETTNKATQLALTLEESERSGVAASLNRASEQAGIYEAALFSSTGGVLAVGGISGSMATPEPPPPQALLRARVQKTFAAIEETPDQVLLRVVVPVNSSDPNGSLRVLQVVEQVPKQLQEDAKKVQAGYRDYQEISYSRGALKRLYAMTLTLTLLLALFSALGLAVVLSEQFSLPLGLLAEGTRAVAQGDFSRRHPVQSRDELGVLTESFNTMTAQLAEAKQKGEESRRAIETTRAYLESILANLSAGVLAFDNAFRLRTANPSAAVILQQPLADLIDVPLADWGRRLPALDAFANLIAEGFRTGRDGQWQRQAQLAVSNHTRVLLMRGSGLPGELCTGARRGVRRCDRARRRAARCRVGGGREATRSRNQEPVDADPAFRRAPGRQAQRQAGCAPTRRRSCVGPRRSWRRWQR